MRHSSVHGRIYSVSQATGPIHVSDSINIALSRQCMGCRQLSKVNGTAVTLFILFLTMNKQTENSINDNTEAMHKRRTRKGMGMGFIVIFLFFVIIVYSQHEVINTIDCTPDIIASKPDVIMLGAWWCRYCYRAKKYFQQNNIHYCEYDMENTNIGKRLYQQHGAGAVPILLIGKYQLNGFSERQIETALTLLKENTDISN